MPRLLVHVEGQTEETFVNELLATHLRPFGYTNVSARLMGNARSRSRRGGVKGWGSVKREILRHLNRDAGLIVTTMADYYALPDSGGKAWPGRKEAASQSQGSKAAGIEKALFADIAADMGGEYQARRFIPFILMHEFEALLFSDCDAFGRGIERPDLTSKFQAVRDRFESPEEIDDFPLSAPSKRIEKLLPGYDKPFQGNLAALEIGLPAMRAACPLFGGWLSRLEGAGHPAA